MPDDPEPGYEAANYFQFLNLGGDIVLYVGQLDVRRATDKMNALVTAAAAGRPSSTPIELTANITHRFLMSQQGLALLREQLNALVKRMENAAPGAAQPSSPT